MEFVITLVAIGLICLGLARFAVWAREKGIGGGIMGPIDEAWHPSADRFRKETAIHEQRVLPPCPGDDRDRP